MVTAAAERTGSTPLDVTVVIPALNRASVIGRALDSATGQVPPPGEVIVVDDGSSDDTAAVARAHGATVISLPQRGGSGPARNRAIAAARTGWIAFLDSDDEWLPGHLARLLAASDDQVLVGAPALSTSGKLLGNTAAEPISVGPVDMLVPGDLVVTSATLVRTDVIRAAGGFRALPRAQDLDLWLRVLEHGPGRCLPPPATISYHEHPGQASKDQQLMRECFDDIMTTYADRDWLTASVRARSYGRVRWDDLRVAQRAADPRGVARELAWFARNPVAVPVVVGLLAQRRRSRAIGGRLPG